MSVYSTSLFVHILGLIVLFGGVVLLHFGGSRLRGANTWQDVRSMLALVAPVRGMFPTGSVLLLATGLYMTSVRWTFSMPWVVVAVVLVVLFSLIGALVVGRGLAGIGRAAGGSDGPISEDARTLLTSPSLWTPAYAMNGGALGIVWLMIMKPGWVGSIGAPLALSIFGGLMGWAGSRSRRNSPKATSG